MQNWEKYTPGYQASIRKQYYDLQLKSAREVFHCWPDAGHFTPVDGSGEAFIEGWKVDSIRISAVQ